MNPDILLHPIVVPMVCAAICYVFGRWAARAGRWANRMLRAVALAGAVWALVAAVALLKAEKLLPLVWRWSNFGPLDLSVVLDAAPLAAFVAVGITFFTFATVVYSLAYREPGQNDGRYLAFILCASAGGVGAVFSKNLLYFLVAWEVVTVMLFLLVNLGGEPARQPAAKSFAILGFSDCAILLGMVLSSLYEPVPGLPEHHRPSQHAA